MSTVKKPSRTCMRQIRPFKGASGSVHSQIPRIQIRIDADVRDRASLVLEDMGLTVSDAVRILLTRTTNEGMLPLEIFSGSEAHDTWFRAKVLEALNDTRPDISNDEVEAHFEKRRQAARNNAAGMTS